MTIVALLINRLGMTLFPVQLNQRILKPKERKKRGGTFFFSHRAGPLWQRGALAQCHGATPLKTGLCWRDKYRSLLQIINY